MNINFFVPKSISLFMHRISTYRGIFKIFIVIIYILALFFFFGFMSASPENAATTSQQPYIGNPIYLGGTAAQEAERTGDDNGMLSVSMDEIQNARKNPFSALATGDKILKQVEDANGDIKGVKIY